MTREHEKAIGTLSGEDMNKGETRPDTYRAVNERRKLLMSALDYSCAKKITLQQAMRELSQAIEKRRREEERERNKELRAMQTTQGDILQRTPGDADGDGGEPAK